MSDSNNFPKSPSSEHSDRLTYTRYQAAERAQISVSHLDRQVKSGHLKAIRHGRRVHFDKNYFDNWILGNDAGPGGEKQ
jgi:excisionase family DNA binding protein